MEIKFKNVTEIEDIALRQLRNSKDKSRLNNKNVDCFVDGYRTAQSDLHYQIDEFKKQELFDKLDKICNDCNALSTELNETLGYSGYMYSQPKGSYEKFKLFNEMKEACEFIKSNLQYLNMHYGDYYEVLKKKEEN